MYVWDSRWAWGLPHMQHSSTLWLIPVMLTAVKLAMEMRDGVMGTFLELGLVGIRDSVALVVLI